MNKKKMIIISSIVFVIAIASIFVSYGFITAEISGNESSKKTVFNGQIIKVEYSDGTETLTSNQGAFTPGTIINKTFTIKNTGNVSVSYSINLDNVINNFERKNDITYELYSNNELLKNGMYEVKGVFPDNKLTILNKDVLDVNESKIYTLKIHYLNSEENQIIDSGSSLSANILVEESKTNINSLVVYGNSVQEETPTPENPVDIKSLGDMTKNLWSYGDLNTKDNINDSFDFNLNGSYVFSFALDYESCNLPGAAMFQFTIDGEIKYISVSSIVTNNSDRTFLVLNGNLTNIKLINWSSLVGDIIDIQLEEGSNMTEYEPYGYKIPVKVSGKNIFDTYNSSVYSIYNASVETIDNGFKYTSNTNSSYNSYSSYILDYSQIAGKTITVSADFVLSKGNTSMIRIGYWNTEGAFSHLKMKSVSVNGRSSLTVDIPSKLPKDAKSSYCIFFNVAVNENMKGATLEVTNIQIEIGNTATSYEQYVEPVTTNIYLNEPLRKVGNNSDYIDFTNNKIFRNIGKEIYDKNTSFSLVDSTYFYENGVTTAFAKNIPSNALPNSYGMPCMTNLLEYKKADLLDKTNPYISGNTNQIIFAVKNETASTLEELKIFLTDNNMEIIYPLAEETTEDIELPIINGNNKNISVCDKKGICASNIEVEYDE